MSESPFQQVPVQGVKHIVSIGSGKGGVGKSTVALNLAVALSKEGVKVGLLDGDIYGPSIPRLTGTVHERPVLEDNKLIPIRRFGLALMSMGYLTPEDAPAVWRGPMLFKAIEQMFHDVNWGKLDLLIVDLPPGTGDVPLTLAQKVPVSGGVVVSTPQNLSLVDTKKAINMFRQIDIPVFGVVENMSYMEYEGKKLELFPKGQIDVYLKEKKIPKLAEISFNPRIALSSESGVPFMESEPDSVEGKAFRKWAIQLKKHLQKMKR